MAKNAHAEIEKIKSDYLDAYRDRWGEAAANLLRISYHKGWWYLTVSPLSTPYRTKEIVKFTENMRKQVNKDGIEAYKASQ